MPSIWIISFYNNNNTYTTIKKKKKVLYIVQRKRNESNWMKGGSTKLGEKKGIK